MTPASRHDGGLFANAMSSLPASTIPAEKHWRCANADQVEFSFKSVRAVSGGELRILEMLLFHRRRSSATGGSIETITRTKGEEWQKSRGNERPLLGGGTAV